MSLPVDHFLQGANILSSIPWFNHSMFIKLRSDPEIGIRVS